MKTVRVIPRLDIKGSNVIKGIQLECLRIVGNPKLLAEKYYLQGADAVAVASILHYNSNSIPEIKEYLSNKQVYIRPVEA